MIDEFFKLTLVTQKRDIGISSYLPFVATCARSGITAVQLREKGLGSNELLDFGMHLKRILCQFSIPLIVNDDVELAYELNADGLHLGQSDGCVLKARQRLGDNKIIGLSLNSLEQLHIANALPINYVGVGAIFHTQHKLNAKVVGLKGLKEIAAHSKHTVIAIGGIKQDNAGSVISSGASGIAAIGAFHHTDDPSFMTQNLRKVIEGGKHA